MNNPHSYPRTKGGTPPQDQLIMGIHCLREVLAHAPHRLIHIYAEEPSKGGRKSDTLELCQKHKVPVSFRSFNALTSMVGSDSHQSFVAHVKGRKYYDVPEFLQSIESNEHALVLMLDQIHDPQNFGALLRSAECFGAHGVVWSKNRGTDLTPVVAKTSCGASELLPLIRIANLAEAVTQFQREGFEAIAALLNPQAERVDQVHFGPKTLLIVGSEGEGIQPLIQKRSDRSVYIPMSGKIESLNVAQAAAVLLSWAQRKNN